MKMVVVGGNSHGIGKTSVAAGIVAALPHRNWLAIKLTQLGYDTASGERSCEGHAQHHGAETGAFAIQEERDRSGTTDTSRFLAAGAQRALWITVPHMAMEAALPEILRAIEGHENVIMESNSILRFFEPNVYLSVLDPLTRDFKASAREFLDRADALLSLEPLPDTSPWPDIPIAILRQKPCFVLGRNGEAPADRQVVVPREIAEFVESRLRGNRDARYLFS
jgi:hypothetical protein